MEQKWYKEKIEVMLTDLLVEIHQKLVTQHQVNISDVELLKELNFLYSKIEK